MAGSAVSPAVTCAARREYKDGRERGRNYRAGSGNLLACMHRKTVTLVLLVAAIGAARLLSSIP